MTETPTVTQKPIVVQKKALTPFDAFKINLHKEAEKQINNYFADSKKALAFMSAVIADVQRNPELLNCTPVSLINAYVSMAQLHFMPSGVSGQAYVIPYNLKGTKTACFQLGYQGLVQLLYRGGIKSIVAEIVRENDDGDMTNGIFTHKIDWRKSNKERGNPIGAYVRIDTGVQDGVVSKYMHKDDILAILALAKSEKKLADPELWKWKKTVLKQAGKLVSKEEEVIRAINLDNTAYVIPETKTVAELGAEPPMIESTEWRDKLREHLMALSPDAPDEGAVYFNITGLEEYPATEQQAQVALGNLLAKKA